MTTFIERSRPCAPRIREKEWTLRKDVLVELYRNNTLPEVMSIMERVHGFVATKRQYVHRFQAWGIKKYKLDDNASSSKSSSETPPLEVSNPGNLTASALSSATPALAEPAVFTVDQASWIPQPDTADDKARHLVMADMLLVLGDFPHCFTINAALRHNEPSQDHSIACVRTAQTRPQADTARNMVKAEFQYLREENDSWATRLFEFLLAYTYDWGNDREHGREQIAKTLYEIVPDDPQGHDCLTELVPREPCLDVLTYVHFRAALVRYNRVHQEDQIHIPAVLQQFMEQQPAFRQRSETATDPILHIDCLSSCLAWCIGALRNDSVAPIDLPGADDNPVAQAYTLLCTLWSKWLGIHPRSPLPPHAKATGASLGSSPAWADNAKRELGISPTELLSTVACMIIAAIPRHAADASKSVCERALAGACALKKLDSERLIHRFLDQVWAANRWLAFRPDEDHDAYRHAANVEVAEAARRFVAKSLGICDLPALEPGAVVHPLVLVDHERSPGGQGLGSASAHGLMAASELFWAQAR